MNTRGVIDSSVLATNLICTGYNIDLLPWVEASMNQVAGNQMRLYDLPSNLLCRVINVELKVKADTDEVYAQVMLMPEPEQNEMAVDKSSPTTVAAPAKPVVRSFCKTLTASDTSKVPA